MSVTSTLLLRAFGRPRGLLGRLGGRVMARMNAEFGFWTVGLLEIDMSDRVLEVGFGPGVIIRRLADLAPDGFVAGIDPSPEMVAQARSRNAAAIRAGRVDIHLGSVERLPFEDGGFDKALAVNAMQVWPDAKGGLLELRRVMKAGAKLALGFTRYSGHSSQGLTRILGDVGFIDAQVLEGAEGFCALATRP
jgi:SAM-dependent methyltransferase